MTRETFVATLLAESRRLAHLATDVAAGRPVAEVVAALELTAGVLSTHATFVGRELV